MADSMFFFFFFQEGNIDQFNQTNPNKKNFKIKSNTRNGKNNETHNRRPPRHHPSLPIHPPHTQTISTIQHHIIYYSNPNQILKIKTHTHDGKLQIVTLPLPPTTCLNPTTAATILVDPYLITSHDPRMA